MQNNTGPYLEHGTARRICPNCGKREFKCYIDPTTGDIIDESVGKCNREIKCGYHLPPRMWYAAHPADRAKLSEAAAQLRPAKPMEMITLPLSYVSAKLGGYDNNNLVKWLRGLPWNSKQRQRLEVALLAYGVGTDKHNRTIFWLIDEDQKVRSGKIMRYNEDGHRDKNPEHKHTFDWVHSILMSAGLIDPEKAGYVGCAFGEHLAKLWPDAKICVVESEKTALICSACYDMKDVVWLATGGSHGLKMIEKFVRAGRDVVLYPDHDAHEKWLLKAYEMKCHVSNIVEAEWTQGLDADNADIGDIIVRKLYKTPNPDIISQDELLEIFKTKNKYFKQLVECGEITLRKKNIK